MLSLINLEINLLTLTSIGNARLLYPIATIALAVYSPIPGKFNNSFLSCGKIPLKFLLTIDTDL